MRSETHLSQIQKTFNCCRYFRGLVLLGCAARASERTAIYMGGKYSGMMARMDTFQAQWPNVLDSDCTSGRACPLVACFVVFGPGRYGMNAQTPARETSSNVNV